MIHFTGCSVYRSEGRKKFESAAPSTVTASAVNNLTVEQKLLKMQNWCLAKISFEKSEDRGTWMSADNKNFCQQVAQAIDQNQQPNNQEEP
ncbi:MAG: hypothetical protein ACOYOK_02635 [Pseudobdellovibrionaceae bacterium]